MHFEFSPPKKIVSLVSQEESVSTGCLNRFARPGLNLETPLVDLTTNTISCGEIVISCENAMPFRSQEEKKRSLEQLPAGSSILPTHLVGQQALKTKPQLDYSIISNNIAAALKSLPSEQKVLILPILIPTQIQKADPIPMETTQNNTMDYLADTDDEAKDEETKDGKEEIGKRHFCTECKAPFKSRFSLNRHKKTHTKERPFKCDNCSKAFAEKASLKRHSQTHSGKKPWECRYENCDKSFADKVNLKRHITKIHER